MQLRLSSLICRIIVLQKYTVCFREEAKLEDCEFYLRAQQFIVLPMERQRPESSDGNQEPSVLQKIKELWLKNVALKNAPNSDPSISQLIDAIGQNQLEVLKENAEECLDLRLPRAAAAGKDEVPVTQWEAERKKEQGEDIFTVPAHTLVIPPEEEEAAACDPSRADTSEVTPGQSSQGPTATGDLSTLSQGSSAESTALSEGSEGSQDDPWNGLPTISLALDSSDDKTPQQDPSLKTQQDVAADTNTPDLLELCSQDSAGEAVQGEPVLTSSPIPLCPQGSTSPGQMGTSRASPAAESPCASPCASGGLGAAGSSQLTLPSLSPSPPAVASSPVQLLARGMPH
ncbi:ACD protein, partial [Urocolius indicus]|nr:ACD protein [Urocolius indicus]